MSKITRRGFFQHASAFTAAGASPKGSTPDAGDGLALDGIRDHQFARGCSFTIGDGDIDVSRGVNKVAEVSSVKWQNCTDKGSKKGLA